MARLDNLLYWDLRRWGYRTRTELADGMSYYCLERKPRRVPDHPRPPVVLLHGIGANLTHWHDVALYLRWWGGEHVYLLDLPGHGRSSMPEGPLTPERLQQLFTSWVDRTLGEQRFVLVGNSLGGSVALKYALEHPDRLAGLIVLSPAVGIETQSQLDELSQVFEIHTRAEASAFLDKLIPRLPWYLGLFRPLLVGAVLDVMRSRGVRDLMKGARLENFAGAERISELKMPMLAVWGGRERVLPAYCQRWLKAHWPPAGEWWEPAAAGHCPQIDYSRPLSLKIAEFLSRIR